MGSQIVSPRPSTEKSSSQSIEFDLIVIGSGTGLDVANYAAQHGMKVAIIEKSKMGGTCLNRGCIPSKLLIHSADVIDLIKNADKFGIKVDSYKVDFKSIVNRVNRIIDSDSMKIREAFEGIENPLLFPYQCRFIDNKTLLIEIQPNGNDDNDKNHAITENNADTNKNVDINSASQHQKIIITADKILIASGTRPLIPQINGLNESNYITSDHALRLQELPRVITIIGGGFIAAELGHFFGSLGTTINIVQRKSLLLPSEDHEISEKFTRVFATKYNVFLDSSATMVEKKEDGQIIVTIKNLKNNDQQVLKSDQLLIATGRKPNSDILDISKSGIKSDEKGFILVDKYLETNIGGIFALGDVIGKYMFKHAANHEAQYAFNNIINPDKKVEVNYHAMPHAIFSHPQVAGAGFTEQQLKKAGAKYRKAIYPYYGTAMGQAIEDSDGFVKFLISNEEKILGCHIIGTDASVLIHEVLVVMKNSGNLRDIQKTIHIHPALSEVVSRAAYSVSDDDK